MLGGGWGADRLGRTRPNGKLLLAAIAMCVAAQCIYLALKQAPGATIPFMLLMGTGTMFSYTYYACVYASIQDVIEPALRGTAMSLYFFAMYILGASFGPVVTGMLSDHFAKKAMWDAGATAMTEQFKGIGLHHAMYVIPLLCMVLAVVLFAASRTVAKDVAKLKAWQAAQEG
jgi:MFS family permease